jgi:hypothetical protein
MPSPRSSAAAMAVLFLCFALPGCGGSSTAGAKGTPAPSKSPRGTVAHAAGVVPTGWHSSTLQGITVAYPANFAVRTDAADVTLQVGIPFTGQPFPPPQVQYFVETGQVGPLEVREPLTRAQITHALGGIVIPPSTPATVVGATAAVEFTYDYSTKAATSTLNTPLKATGMRQSDLLIDAPGLPKYGMRYSAPVDQYDKRVWEQLVAALSVSADRKGS